MSPGSAARRGSGASSEKSYGPSFERVLAGLAERNLITRAGMFGKLTVDLARGRPPVRLCCHR